MVAKSVMLLGAAVLLGTGIARYWLIGRGARAAAAMGWLGCACLCVASLVDVRATLVQVLPTADAALLLRYLTTTAHGAAVQARVSLACALAVLMAASPARARGAGVAFAIGSAALLSTFSAISHAAAMGGWWPFVSDLVHTVAACLWAGAVFAIVTAAELWRPAARDALVSAVSKLSALGLATVLVLSATGVVNALLHAGDPAAFLASGYTQALAVKLLLVLVTVGVAAMNRFRFLPRLVVGGSAHGLRSSLRVEAMLLAAVLVATGWLSTTAVPHDASSMGGAGNVIENAGRLMRYLWP